MLASSSPTPFPIPFASSAGAGYIRTIPTASQISITPGAASLTDGFPPLNFLPATAGGVPPFGQDMNGVINEITAAIQWMQAGGLPVYNSTFQTAIGGYPNGAAILNSNLNGFWVSTVDSNLTNPNTGGAGWRQLSNTYLDKSVAGLADVTLTALESVYPIIDLGGALTGNINVILPTAAGEWTIKNSTTGSYLLTVKMATGAGVVVTQGTSTMLYSDGTNVDYVVSPQARIKLTANLNLYVATTGSDTANTGLAVGSPFLTTQKAVDTIYANYDLNGFQVTVNLADGTYTGQAYAIGEPTGYSRLSSNSPIIFNGNSVTPSNVLISTTSLNCFYAQYGGIFKVQNMKMQTATSGSCLFAKNYGIITSGVGLVFGAAAENHCSAVEHGNVSLNANYSITGSAVSFANADACGIVNFKSTTGTLSGTPAFTQFVNAVNLGLIESGGMAFSGAATGKTYNADANGVINTAGSGTSFPGGTGGTKTNGGQLV